MTPEMNALADALAGLKPRPAALNRDVLMYGAGRASAARGWKWPLATAITSLVALGLGVALLVRPQPRVVERIEYVKVEIPVPAPPTPETPPASTPADAATLVTHEDDAPPRSGARRLEDHLLRWGFDGLPPAPHAEPPKDTADSLFRSL
jgi:hypothetical protein